MEFVKDPYGTGHHLYLDNFYTSPVPFNLLRARGILAAGTARPRQGYPSNDLKSVQLERRGQVAWLTWEEMIALRWKDRKDVFFLSTIHAPPEVPYQVDAGLNAPYSDPENDRPNPDVVKRRVKFWEQWETQKIYRPQIVSDYNNFMGEVDLCDQMTNMNKSKKQIRWYMRVFEKFLLIACFDVYIMEGQVIDHNGRRKRKRNLLQFKQDLCIQLVGNTPGKNS